MPSHVLSSEDAKQRVVEAVRAVESRSSLELVVCVRGRSDAYREVPVIVGAALAFITLAFLLFSPWSFPLAAFLTDVAVAFAVGALIARRSRRLTRLFTTAARRREAVDHAARATFYDQGVLRTTGRTGLLLFVSLGERELRLIPDVGVPVEAIGGGLLDIEAALTAALRGRGNLGAFVEATEGLGPLCADLLPRAEDDVNELSDEVVTHDG